MGVAFQADPTPHPFNLDFEPFRALDASGDPRLHEYLVAHDKFEAIWRDEVSFLFAPAGGGKSAFRARLAGACRAGEDGRRVFPIVYMLSKRVVRAHKSKFLEAHLRSISETAAFELFLHLAYHPREFISLDLPTRQMARYLLERGLPYPLSYLLEQLAAPTSLTPEGRLRSIAQSYDPGATWFNPPSEENLAEFRRVLERTPALPADAQPEDELEAWLDLLPNKLHFEAIYLLVDGVDAYPETINNPEQALALLRPLLEKAEGWRERRLFVKAFLPIEMESSVRDAVPTLTSQNNVVMMEWTRELLIELLKRRVAAAKGWARGSLGMLSRPGFRDVDERVVDAVIHYYHPLPREVLAFTNRMLVHAQSPEGTTRRLSLADFEGALNWYRDDRRQEQF